MGVSLACSLALALLAGANPAAARGFGESGRDSGGMPQLGDPISTGPGMLQQPAEAPAKTNAPATSDANADQPIDFEADQVDYQNDTDIVTANGNVFLRRGEQTVRADKVTWNRKTGQIMATGNIRVVDRNGNELLTDQLELTDQLDTGETENLLMLLREGGRLAANRGERMADGNILLTHAAYTACDVIDANGCPKKPTWRITARHVIYDPDQKLVHFKGARLSLFGLRLLPLPSVTIATDGRPVPGLLIPNFRTSASNGVELSDSYYQHLGPNRDITVTTSVYSKVQPMVSVHYRALTDTGAYQITGYATKSVVIPQAGTAADGKNEFRGYIEANGHFQLSPVWGVSFSGRLASDRTFLSRYYISGDDILRSNLDVERIDRNSYLSIAGWSFETLRSGSAQGQQPIALPEIDYRRRLDQSVLGGQVQLQANSLAISRTAGQDTQRAFASAEWDLRRMTGMGQIVTLTALVRGDVYHSRQNTLTSSAIYQGAPGWQTRGVALVAADMTWPFVGSALGGTQVLTPHIQVVAAPSTPNLSIPNEDARAIELEDDNLFSLNRFPGYDRIENGTRFTYGVDWQLERPRWRVNATVGQSYRLTSQPTLLPDGTGLSGQLSDLVGRTEIRFRDFFKITHRYRLDKDTLAVRRNELDGTIGDDQNYLEVGYARLNRNIAAAIEDLQDSNELRAAGRVAFARYWSLFGSGIADLSGTNWQNLTRAKAIQPLRTRFGIAFQSDCFQFDFTWRRDYVTIGDAARGSSFEVHFALRNLGFR